MCFWTEALATGHLEHAHTALDAAVTRGRALVLDEQIERNRTAAAAPPSTTSTALASARERYAMLLLRSTPGEPIPQATLRALRLAADRAEEAVLEGAHVAAAPLMNERAGVDEVRHALPASQPPCLICPRRVTWRPRAPIDTSLLSQSLEGPFRSPLLVLARRSTGAVTAWRERGQNRAYEPGTTRTAAPPSRRSDALRRLVWDPLRLNDRLPELVFVVLDGTLQFVNLSALPLDRERFVLEEPFSVHYLTSEGRSSQGAILEPSRWTARCRRRGTPIHPDG